MVIFGQKRIVFCKTKGGIFAWFSIKNGNFPLNLRWFQLIGKVLFNPFLAKNGFWRKFMVFQKKIGQNGAKINKYDSEYKKGVLLSNSRIGKSHQIKPIYSLSFTCLLYFLKKKSSFYRNFINFGVFLSENKYFRVKPHRIRVSWRGPICLEW